MYCFVNSICVMCVFRQGCGDVHCALCTVASLSQRDNQQSNRSFTSTCVSCRCGAMMQSKESNNDCICITFLAWRGMARRSDSHLPLTVLRRLRTRSTETHRPTVPSPAFVEKFQLEQRNSCCCH